MDQGASHSSLENTFSFDQVLHDTVRMIRQNWKASVCLFLQTDDNAQVRIRAADGVPPAVLAQRKTESMDGFARQALAKSEIQIVTALPAGDPLGTLLNPFLSDGKSRMVIVPVTGEARALGLLVMGPFPPEVDLRAHENEFRSAGALCTVLSAHWRLYEWMSHFLPQMNHEIRTPLTAVQGSLGMVLGGMFGNLGSEVRSMLEMAHKGCERTVRAMEQYLNRENPPESR